MSLNSYKILVLGNGCSGKSTLSKYLSKTLKIPLLHLDKIYWIKEGWQENDLITFLKLVDKHMEQAKWIVEGTPMPGAERRIAEANMIIFLDASRLTCLYRLIKRSIFSLLCLRKQDDGCPVKTLDWKTIKWIWNFNKRKRLHLLTEVERANCPQKHIVKNKSELSNIIQQLEIQ